MAEAALMEKFKQDLSQFERSIKEMQSNMKSLNATVAEMYGESLPRVAEFNRALQDENTLMDNLARDIRYVEQPLRTHRQEYNVDGSSSTVGSANRRSEFVSKVLSALFKGEAIFFSESYKVSQVLSDIVSQTKHNQTPREVKLTRELQLKLDGQAAKATPAAGRLAPPSSSTVSSYASDGGGHRGPGSLAGGAYGSPKPQMSPQIKPASRLTSQNTPTRGTRIYI